MSDDSKKDGTGVKVAESLGEALLKELTLAMVENMKATRALTAAVLGTDGEGENDEGQLGLLEAVSMLQETVEAVDERITGLAVKLSAVEFVLDGLSAIAEGNLDATPPVIPRVPHWEDAARLKRDFDKRLDEEQTLADEAERKALEEAAATEQPPPPPPAPARPSMLSNAGPKKALPALPVVQE